MRHSNQVCLLKTGRPGGGGGGGGGGADVQSFHVHRNRVCDMWISLVELVFALWCQLVLFCCVMTSVMSVYTGMYACTFVCIWCFEVLLYDVCVNIGKCLVLSKIICAKCPLLLFIIVKHIPFCTEPAGPSSRTELSTRWSKHFRLTGWLAWLWTR